MRRRAAPATHAGTGMAPRLFIWTHISGGADDSARRPRGAASRKRVSATSVVHDIFGQGRLDRTVSTVLDSIRQCLDSVRRDTDSVRLDMTVSNTTSAERGY